MSKPALWRQVAGAKAVRGPANFRKPTREAKFRPRMPYKRPLTRRRRIRSVSPKRAKQNALYRKLRRAFLAEHALCHACMVRRELLSIKASTQIHHIRGKIGKLLTDVRFWCAVCDRCHRWITDHTTEARALGLICEKGKWNERTDHDTAS